MKQNIDVLIVIREQVTANILGHNIALSMPGLRLCRVRTPEAALTFARSHKVNTLIIGLPSEDLARIDVHAFQRISPKTLLLLLPFKLSGRHKWLALVLAWLSDYQLRHAKHTQQTCLAHQALSAMEEAVISCNRQGLVTYINNMAEYLIGLKRSDAIGRPLSSILEVAQDPSGQALINQMEQAIANNKTVPQQWHSQLIHKNGEKTHVRNSVAPILDQAGINTGAVLVLHKASRNIMTIRKIYHQANYDYLTDLPNRALLMERLNLAIRLAIRHHKQVGLLFVDLDHFKLVNDSLGHDAGDQLLKSVSGRLVDCVRTSDTVCRHGGDEFTILLTEVANFGDCEQVAQKILDAFSMPHQLDNQVVVISLSIGISVFPCDAENSDMMFRHADQAMYLAKKKGRNRFEVYPYESSSALAQN
ncbi:sensor domain-containing diguanylate cyclase [Bowmanella yangjiangensis]|uniref:Sensor domain-containing diguanylate cyclase n=1 Tax=Bowmanella yangjiangensis TaxID=2811230 RepID=A0ABS3CQ35_9ALTE|nr:sensor domain-containing diguanylate cyclase [Bowmanella yangjiangensis]MBN7818395.1 sensor domain-containing diguanylate cyclase [Bowmanella yangjiangensis]